MYVRGDGSDASVQTIIVCLRCHEGTHEELLSGEQIWHLIDLNRQILELYPTPASKSGLRYGARLLGGRIKDCGSSHKKCEVITRWISFHLCPVLFLISIMPLSPSPNLRTKTSSRKRHHESGRLGHIVY